MRNQAPAVILPGTHAAETRDIVLWFHDGPLLRISDLHPSYQPLQYPILFPRGENGWCPEMKLTETDAEFANRVRARERERQERHDRGIEAEGDEEDVRPDRRLTLSRYVCYRIHQRHHEDSALLRGGSLFTRYMVDMYASIDQQRLLYISLNQSTIRAARFNNLEDATAADTDLGDIGKRIHLPSSYTGGPRNMVQGFQDSMALARYYRKVDIFLTMTTNPNWPEIQQELYPGQTAYDRPELVARVFRLKKNALLEFINKHGVFGTAAAYVYTIEFQKRGLPHMHLLLFFEEAFKLLNPAAIDTCIWARWPDPVTQPDLFKVVKDCMVHTCSPRCLDNGKCSKGYPKPFCKATTMDPRGYPQYYRPDDGREYLVNGRMVDNRWIIPYPPRILCTFRCHINCECAISLGCFKYAFKYIQKGPDRGTLEVEQKDEVKRYIDGRYISAPDAAWRILQFETHEQQPNVVRLQVHLPDQHTVVFNPDDEPELVVARGANQRTTLTAFFEANADHGPLGEEARRRTYQEFPQVLVYKTNKRSWSLRQRGFALGRMYFISPSAGELFYLRTLLTVVKGPTSFEDLRTVPGQAAPFPTYYAACLARGLLEDDGEWRICLLEACEMNTGHHLRHLFATILLFGEPAQPGALWNEFRHLICDDLRHRLMHNMQMLEPTDETVYDYGLYLIDRILRDSGSSLANWPSMPQPQLDWHRRALNPFIAEQLDYDRVAELHDYEARLIRLNGGQRVAFDEIIHSLEDEDGRTFFLKGSGGTGKTFVYNTICAKLRSEGKIVLCVSSSGISAILLRGGRTSHSTFKIPVDGLDQHSSCNITKNSAQGDLMREVTAIIWDEISAQHRHCVEAVDRTLQDIRNNSQPFGGITVILGGDFLQTLPVVPRGSREDILDATIQRSALWPGITTLELTENMRLDATNLDSQEFAQWLLDVGHGRNMVEDSETQIRFPDTMRVGDEDELINSIYPGVGTNPPPAPEYFLERMILAPHNADVSNLNQEILNQMAGEQRQFISADEIVHEQGADPREEEMVPVEFLRAIDASGLPPGELNLKVGSPVILLRNLEPKRGLCNGTRMVITRMGDRVLEGSLIGGDHHGQIAMIPRISLIPSSLSDHSFKLKRRQFPIRLAFTLSINKAQGQSVRSVGLCLRNPVFAHGQLYVALSRARASTNIKILLSAEATESLATNIVYPDVLI